MKRRPPRSPLFPYPPLFRSNGSSPRRLRPATRSSDSTQCHPVALDAPTPNSEEAIFLPLTHLHAEGVTAQRDGRSGTSQALLGIGRTPRCVETGRNLE